MTHEFTSCITSLSIILCIFDTYFEIIYMHDTVTRLSVCGNVGIHFQLLSQKILTFTIENMVYYAEQASVSVSGSNRFIRHGIKVTFLSCCCQIPCALKRNKEILACMIT